MSELNYTPFRKSLIDGKGALQNLAEKVRESQNEGSAETRANTEEGPGNRLEPTLSGESF